MRKTMLFLSVLTLFLTLVACQRPAEVTFMLPDEEVYEVRTVEEDGRLASYPTPVLQDTYFLGWYTDKDFTTRFDIEQVFENDATLYAETLPYEGELLTPFTDRLTLEQSQYENKTFRDDGIGEATLNSCTDGDTTNFNAPGFVTVRYLNIDTPESTITIEPWGPASSRYVCDVLSEADTIVLEYEPHPELGHPSEHPTVERTGTFGRDLAYVWYDGRLLNLELIELGFSRASATGNSQYGEYLRLADRNARMTGRHIHGESDPLFEQDVLDVTITELRDNTEAYMYRFVNVEGTITSVSGSDDTFDLWDGERTIRVYYGHSISSKIRTGHQVAIMNLFLTEWRGNLQLTNFDSRRTEVLDTDAPLP